MTIPVSVVAASGSIVDIDATIFIQLIVFLLMFFLLRSLLFRPVIALIEKRRHITEGTRQEAEKFEKEAEALFEDVERQLAEVQETVSKEREKMVEGSKRQAGEVLQKAREDSSIVVSQAKEETATKAEQVRETRQPPSCEVHDQRQHRKRSHQCPEAGRGTCHDEEQGHDQRENRNRQHVNVADQNQPRHPVLRDGLAALCRVRRG